MPRWSGFFGVFLCVLFASLHLLFLPFPTLLRARFIFWATYDHGRALLW